MKNIIAANQVQTESDRLAVAYKAADASIEAAYKAADKTIADTVATNKTSQDAAIASAIANWASDRQYKTDQITIRNKTFFLCLKDNVGRDPLTDTAGNWSVFAPGSVNDVFANRSPVASDVYPVGVKWWDVSFGSDTPLGFLSLGGGAWQFLNQISLSKIRFFGYGHGSTWQSALNNIKFFKEDGTQISNGWFVWGASSGLGKPTNGTAFSGQNITGQYNASGWADLEPSSLFDLSVSIAKITAGTAYFNFTKLQFIYSNGGVKTYGLGDLSPVPQSRYGDSIAAVLGETLTAVKLSDSSNRDPGRVTGEAFTSAWNVLYQAQPAPPSNGITHAYANATDRAAGTGYTPTTDDVAEANLFLELSTDTLWRCTDDNPLAWVQIAASIPQTPVSVDGVAALKAIAAPTDGTARFVKSLDEGYQFRSTYIANAAGTPIAAEAQTPTDGTPGVWLPVSVPRSADDWVIAATDRTSLSTYYTRRLVGAPVTSIEFEVNEPSTENARTTKRVISIPDFPAVMAGTATVLDQQSVSANSGYYGGPTVFIRPSVGGVQSSVAVCAKSDGTVIIYNSNLAGTIAGLIRRVKINGIPADPQFYRNLTIPDASPPNWIDRMDYTVTAATSIADGLVAGSLISGLPGVTFLRGNRDRKAVIKQATATTLGALFTAVNARLTAAALATTDIAYRRSVSAGWVYFDGTDPDDAATVVPSGWYVVSINGTDLNIEPLATNVSQIVSYTGTSPDIPANIGMAALALNTGTNSITHWWNTSNLTWVAASPNLPAHSTAEHLTGETWTNGKAIYRKTWTGTTPNNANDNALFTATGATEIVRFFGRVVNGTRVADMFGVHSGSAAHGPAAQFYGNELHWFNNTGDTRWQSGAYVVTVCYTK